MAFFGIAPPERSGLSQAEASSSAAAYAVELYHKGLAVGNNHGNGFCTLDQLLTEGRRLTLCAADNVHFTEPDHFGGKVVGKPQASEPEALLSEVRDEAFSSSSSPEIKNIDWDVGHDHVNRSAVVSVVVQGQGSAAVLFHEQTLTRASVPLAGFADPPWQRMTSIARAGEKAWSRPSWVT